MSMGGGGFEQTTLPEYLKIKKNRGVYAVNILQNKPRVGHFILILIFI